MLLISFASCYSRGKLVGSFLATAIEQGGAQSALERQGIACLGGSFDAIGCRLNTAFGLARLVTCAHVSDGFG